MKRTWLAGIIAVAAGAAFAQSGGDVVKSKGCLNCHAVDTKKMGPSFKDIAAKHKSDKGAADAIAAKLKEGKGHPKQAASDADLLAITKWIQAQ